MRSIARILDAIHRLVRQGRMQLTAKATAEADELGCEREDVAAVLLALRAEDYDCRLTSEHTGEPMYVFKPWLVGIVVYLKVVVRSDCIVVSFHENHDEDDK